MAKSLLKVATIVGSSTPTAWSQTYHAGGVTAIVSVSQKEGTEASSLSVVGKDLLNTFESEYFSLATKTLASIKEAVSLTYNKSKENYTISLIVSAVIQNAIYVFLAGSGKILLTRRGNIATLLEQTGEDVLSASGFLESGDIITLETLAFEEKVPSHVLLNALTQNNVTDSAEILSPAIHKEPDGASVALLLSYQEEHVAPSDDIPSEKPEEKHEEPLPQEEQEETIIAAPPLPASEKKRVKLTHKQKIFLTIAVVLAVVFIGAIYFSLQKKQTTQNTALFSQLFTPAEKKYEEGQGLKDLNPSLAHDDFVQAQQMLEGAKGKFPQNSSEEKQIQTLLNNIQTALGPNTTPAQTTAATKVDVSTSPLLAFALKHTDASYFSQDDSNFYFADSNGITKVAKSGGTNKQIIENGGDWKTLGGFQTYLGNMYIVDTADGVDKYPVTASGFGNKAAYFTGNTPDLSQAVSMAIDGSLWILTKDATILKYTKGSKDSFTISGLTTPLSHPTHIVTTVDDDNVYILDNGNARLVVLKKDGSFVAEYANAVMKQATQVDVNESGKKAYVLSGGNVYEISLK